MSYHFYLVSSSGAKIRAYGTRDPIRLALSIPLRLHEYRRIVIPHDLCICIFIPLNNER